MLLRLGSALLLALAIVLPGSTSAQPLPLPLGEKDDEPKPWCAPELDVLSNDVCFHGEPPEDGRRTLVIFLHGLVKEGAGWQHNQQRGIIRGGKRQGFSVITPRGVTGISRHGDDMVAWPTGMAARNKHEKRLLAQWSKAIEEAEEKIGEPFDEVFAVGFSNGAYYASSLLARAPFDIDGYAVFAGGTAYTPQKPSRRAPVFVGICSKDSTAKHARKLVKLLKKHKWPHKAESRRVGHMMADKHLDHAIAYLRAQTPKKAADESD
jgi:predicted esterase